MLKNQIVKKMLIFSATDFFSLFFLSFLILKKGFSQSYPQILWITLKNACCFCFLASRNQNCAKIHGRRSVFLKKILGLPRKNVKNRFLLTNQVAKNGKRAIFKSAHQRICSRKTLQKALACVSLGVSFVGCCGNRMANNACRLAHLRDHTCGAD